jgi:hexosaminidase
MKKIFVAFSILFTLSACAQQTPKLNIIPEPATMKLRNGPNFKLTAATKLYVTKGAENSAAFLQDYLKKYYGFSLATTSVENTENSIRLFAAKPNANNNGDDYSLVVWQNRITLHSTNPERLFNAVQSLIQLFPAERTASFEIPALEIHDYPRFQYRGLHLDVSRHIFPVEYIKKYIDYIALHKMNYFHWHLTDDQGWRIEIKKYPKLTSVGAWRKGTIVGLFPGTSVDTSLYGGFYTQEQVKEIVKYAADRYITVIPEIEMPAHSMAVLAAYPQLSTTPELPKKVAETWGIYNRQNNVMIPTEETFQFLENVLTEVMALFPSKYIHIGGDEAAKKWWKESARTQAIMKEKGLKDENALQSYFIQRMEKFVNSKGKTIIGWDEILEGGLAPNAVVMSWRGEKGGIAAAKEKHMVIMTPQDPMYFNQSQMVKDDSLTAAGKYIPLENVYKYEPVPKELNAEEAKYVWGAQANLWTEYIANIPKVEYMLFPRLSALSEVLWSPKEKRDWSKFQTKLPTQKKRYELWGANYFRK